MSNYFWFDLVWFLFKKNNQTEFKKKTETSSNRPVSVRFLEQKPVETGLTRFFPVFLGLGSVQFGFRLIKPKPNQTGRFFQNFNRFFSWFGFFGYFFSGFLSLISFSVFLLTPRFNNNDYECA